jgi:predicted hydrocarbon binding protein
MAENEGLSKRFTWRDLGDIGLGRPNLGMSVPVSVYRLLQYTMRDVLIERLGQDAARETFVRAGELAGREFCRNLLERTDDFSRFIANLQAVLRDIGIGILRVEELTPGGGEMTVTVAEDLDCSGLPVSDETVCEYDEGFLAGVLAEQTGRRFVVREIDCWASGDRVCRFHIKAEETAADE